MEVEGRGDSRGGETCFGEKLGTMGEMIGEGVRR